jgi:hypothetical protein
MQRPTHYMHLVQLENGGLSLPATLAVSIEDEVVYPTHTPTLAFMALVLHLVLHLIIMLVTIIAIAIAVHISIDSLLKHQFQRRQIVEHGLNFQIV